MEGLHLRLFGGLEARLASGARVDIPIRKAQALLAYLALHPGKTFPREKLASLLWSDRGDKQAHGSLRQALTVLRKALEPVAPSPLSVDRSFVGLMETSVEVDAVTFARLVAGGTPTDLEAAAALYQGDLLDGFAIRDPAFEAWLEEERRHLAGLMGRALAQLMEHHREAGELDRAVAIALRLLAMDPLQERVHRALMGLHAAHGHREAALQQYQRCRDLLESELGVQPEAETEALYQAIRRQQATAEVTTAAMPARSDMPDDEVPANVSSVSRSAGTAGRAWQWPAVALSALILMSAGALAWLRPWQVQTDTVPVERAGLPLPDRPSIAVLPFADLSVDQQQQVFASGLTADLITDLSKISGLFVIARDSSFAYKDKAASVQQVAAELGVRYVIEGKVRHSRGVVRINVQLIDAATGQHLWAERYDRDQAELFAVQDDVIERIVSALAVQLTDAEQALLARIPTDNLEAYDHYLRAEQEGYLHADSGGLRNTLSFYARAIELDPEFAEAHAGYARTAAEIWRRNFNNLLAGTVARRHAYDAAGRALRLDPDNARAYLVLALIQLVDGRHEEAMLSARKAVALQPNDPAAHAELGLLLALSGNRQQAVAEIEVARRLNPNPPAGLLLQSGIVYYTDRRYDDAVSALAKARKAMPNSETVHEYLAAAHAYRGETELARREREAILKTFPVASLAYYEALYAHYRRDEDRRHHLEGLRKAGITSWPYGFQGNDEDRVEGPGLRSLVFDRTWVGRHQSGVEFLQHIDAAGQLGYRSTNSFLTGNVRVRGDTLCQRFDGEFLSRDSCGHVYRNTAAVSDRTEDYIFVSPDSLKYFSITD